ncbi:uncharacterized protein NFIA_094250 [Aspergillus fischeri NRRL 181]|uniref:Uncharacterized protein n=1 Tax=Neosartorya fischeri (strain ATCC 1020 / DSM 3700 / CBS 544.65 / FGSC A1164 / JCM 1740 / NRRL 181 / WB 181) TaxID=331117 RepID=A1DAB5_NEOFI|nr:conserved hypothetical protein [Aspergillus fischeri NRRL 181]EAW19805.1 conserved hypothetical protein [Aspergillus fischeri NRRL 181]
MVSAKWHPPYAEDQPYPHLILTTHVLDRGFQAGSVLGVAVGIVRALRSRNPYLSAASIITRSTGSGAFLGACTMAIVLPIRMAGKERIEWQDRAWRLLENKGQVEVDSWTTMGMVAGVGTTAVIMRRNALRLEVLDHLVGGAALGNLAGVVGYLGWRYGVNGGHRD